MRLTLVRHGESTWNAEGRWQGQRNDVPLSPRGERQAVAIGARLSDRAFAERFASDLRRAVQTAEAIGGELRFEARLREVDVGDWSGLLHGEVQDRFPEQMRALQEGAPIRIGGGESMAGFEARVDAIAEELAGAHRGEPVLAVCHGGVIRALTQRALGLRGTHAPMVGVRNTSVTELLFEPGEEPRVATYNDVTHLAETDPETVAAPGGPGLVAVLAAGPHEPPADLTARVRRFVGPGSFAALASAAGRPLAQALGAEAVAWEALRAPGSMALVAAPEDIPRVVGAELLGLSERGAGGLAPPRPETVSLLVRTGGGEGPPVLITYGAALP